MKRVGFLGDGDGVVFVVGRPNMAEDAVGDGERDSHVGRAIHSRHVPTRPSPRERDGRARHGTWPVRFVPGRGYENHDTGRDTPGQLAAMREGETKGRCLLLGSLGGNMLDLAGATTALEAADVVVVTGPRWQNSRVRRCRIARFGAARAPRDGDQY